MAEQHSKAGSTEAPGTIRFIKTLESHTHTHNEFTFTDSGDVAQDEVATLKSKVVSPL